jgi:hypothetical protein
MRNPRTRQITTAVFVLLVGLAVAAAPAVAAGSTPPTPAPTRAAPRARQPRVMVALVFGQSNAANFGQTRYKSGPGVYNFYNGYLYYARDPLRGANGEGGSVWTRLGDRLIAEKVFDTVIFVPVAVGGTEIARWAPDGDLHKQILQAIDAVKRRGYKITHLLWHQGESDAVLFTSKADYQQRFLAMLASIRAHGVDAPVLVAVATRCGQYPVSQEIQQAQQGLVNPAAGIFAGPDTDLLDGQYRYDGCHFSTDGLTAHAEMWLQQIKAQMAYTTIP